MAHVGLSRERILEAALGLVDARGLEQLTMRALGQALGVEAMSLYRYVTGKPDLLDGVHARVLEQMGMPPREGAWDRRLAALAHAFRRALLAHPNALPIFATRPAVAPGSLAAVDAALGLLAAAGFAPADQLAALHALVGYVVGTCLRETALPAAERPQVPYAELPADGYPNLRRLAPAIAVEDTGYEFEVGLEALLAGLAPFARRAAPAPTPAPTSAPTGLRAGPRGRAAKRPPRG